MLTCPVTLVTFVTCILYMNIRSRILGMAPPGQRVVGGMGMDLDDDDDDDVRIFAYFVKENCTLK